MRYILLEYLCLHIPRTCSYKRSGGVYNVPSPHLYRHLPFSIHIIPYSAYIGSRTEPGTSTPTVPYCMGSQQSHTQSLQPHSSSSNSNSYTRRITHTHTQNRCFIPRAPAANQVGAQAQAPPLHFPHAIFLVLLFQGIGQMVIQGPPRIQEISCTTYTNHPAPTPRACQLSPHHPHHHIIHRKSRAVYQILQTHNRVVSTLYLLILQVLLPLTRVANRASAVFALRKTAVALSFLPRAANQRILGHLRKVKIWGGAIQGVLQNKPCATRKRYSVTIWTIQYRRRKLLPIK